VQFAALSCTKDDVNDVANIEFTQLIQYSKTDYFKQISEDENSLELNKVQLISIPNQNNINALILPYKTNSNIIKFAVAYSKVNEFQSLNSKTLIIEISNTEGKEVVNSIKAKKFNGFIKVYNPEKKLLYSVRYKDNAVIPFTDVVYLADLKREEVCSVDGIGSCAGKKFESQGWIEMGLCLVELPICMAVLAADCYIENCL
jgi:hypothetical protein